MMMMKQNRMKNDENEIENDEKMMMMMMMKCHLFQSRSINQSSESSSELSSDQIK